ncbi:hypothetical protein M7I_4770 [Glarea lozoyensis 74030]|uniref:Uncharacterized protein n=1 Tax=Glarea lozoyensis (strain ATCC 74030 / MF5533) TaxID=1104152 RepID=H0EQ27_GLAL7|nr:hypothetical protein M7I_4770 [Glarea lozoyensis 74030]
MMASPENCTRPQTQESTCLHESTERPSLDTNPDDFSSSLSQTDIPALEKNLKHLLAYPTSFDDVLNPHMHAAIMFIMDHIIPCAGQVVPPDSMQGDVMRVLSRFGREWPLSGRRRVGDYSEDKKHPTLGLKRDSEIINQIDKKYGNYQPPTVETIQDEAFNKLVW